MKKIKKLPNFSLFKSMLVSDEGLNSDLKIDQKQVWNNIAPKWNEVRTASSPEVIEFLKDKKGNILDFGCGSGRNFIKNKESKRVIYAVDFSEEMLEYAKKKAKKEKINAEFFISDSTKLQFKDNFFDSAICVAMLHCIESSEKREKTLKELYRVLKPKAKALVLVWSRNNMRIKNKPKESFIPWTVKGKKYQRYTYIYDKDEFEKLLKKVGFKVLSITEGKNINAVVQK
ncbi:MAG: methyltransferase domain-containing protein [Nanoarchaeota archaeon]|nr:methyltransferase domain-containing protein [Nanoarchaeota archaeon]